MALLKAPNSKYGYTGIGVSTSPPGGGKYSYGSNPPTGSSPYTYGNVNSQPFGSFPKGGGGVSAAPIIPKTPQAAAPQTQIPDDATFQQSLAQMLGLNSGSFFGGMGGPPEPGQPQITSGIPLAALQQQYLPDSVVQTGVSQEYGKLMQQANPQPILEQYGANQNNMASAASGQYQPHIMGRMMDPLQQAGMVAAERPLAAQMDRYRFGTKGHTAQSQEVLNLANVANDWYGDRLQNWERQFAQRVALANQFFG